MDQPVVSAVAVISYVTSVESFAAFDAVIVQCPARSPSPIGAPAFFRQATRPSAAIVRSDQRNQGLPGTRVAVRCAPPPLDNVLSASMKHPVSCTFGRLPSWGAELSARRFITP